MQNPQEKTEYYTQGNLAAKVDILFQEEQKESFQPKVIEGQKKSVAIELKKGYTLLLFFVIMLFIGICVIYLKSLFSVVAIQSETDRLKLELEALRNQNAQIENRIQKTVNLEKIYEIATTRLNMRLPEKGEIHYISKKSNSYTIKLNQRTYREENNNFKQFISFILKDWKDW